MDRLPEFGAKGRAILRDSTVAVVGVGGLGCAAATSLALSGVGTMVLIDPDLVHESDLGRQTLFSACDVGQRKVMAACSAIQTANPDVETIPVPMALDAANAGHLLRRADVVVDGTDGLEVRWVLNRAAVAGKPTVFAGAVGWHASVLVVGFGTPCFRCVYGLPPAQPTCAENGIVTPVVAIAGHVQALEAIKVLLDVGEPLVGRLWTWDGLRASGRTIRTRRDPNCPECGGVEPRA